MFSTQSDNCIPFVHAYDIISLFAAELEQPKIGISGKGFKFTENGRTSFKKVHNTGGKGEIAHYKQFLLLPQYFPKSCNATTKNQGLFGKVSSS